MAQLVSKTITPFNLAKATIYVDTLDFPLVVKSVILLQYDIEMLTGNKPSITYQISKNKHNLIIIGSVEKSAYIKQLITEHAISIQSIDAKWEAYKIQMIRSSNLLIVGSDRRGTAYGVMELTKQLGVSPWNWWADVPVKKTSNIYINTSININDAPKVKYRGIFINDEAPALSSWTKEKFGGFNHQFYEKVFELLLRLKANYLWPAMWGNAFNDDDKYNNIAANDYGIVMGTSHHEPMLRAQQEWKRYGKGQWNYEQNDTILNSFWRKGIENMGQHESIITVGMRGDGDAPMTEGTATALLERIVKNQRSIIEDVTKKPASATPQLWALYKEVQDYYDKGMRVPDDITLLLCDDNYGNIRKLPKLDEQPRKGGYGIYYHFDYVGGPRNYKWLNTNSIARIWEQMHLAWEYQVRQIWIVNVGDIKPMELPISFFLDYAWNPTKYTADNFSHYHTTWAAEQFSKGFGKEIGELLNKYTQYNARRKPELVDANSYNLLTEWPEIVKNYNKILSKAEAIEKKLPVIYHDAFFQLVLHPIKACANLNNMYYYVALNKDAFNKKLAIANVYADKVKQLYTNDSLITLEYHQLNNGKWNGMMSQTHIGYTYWQQPNKQIMPEVNYVSKDSSLLQNVEKKNLSKSAKSAIPKNSKSPVFYELNSYASLQAAHFTKAIGSNYIQWQTITAIGRDGDGVTTFPVTHSQQAITSGSPHLEYDFYTYSKGEAKLNLYFSPTLNFLNTTTGLTFAVSIDDEKPQVITLNKEEQNRNTWQKWVADNCIIITSNHTILMAGKHTINYWLLDAGIVLQKLVLHYGALEPSYLGPSETIYKP